MNRVASMAELLERGIEIRPHEAVAIVLQLIHERNEDACPASDVPAGPVSVARVQLHADGSTSCIACEATPAVSELANLLQNLIPPGRPGVPGGLRYTIARALLDVDAPPFDSLEDFSGALARFERGDRREVVRKLLERSESARGTVAISRRRVPTLDPRAGEGDSLHAASPSPSDRRVPAVTVTELRRQLREADQRLFAHHAEKLRVAPLPPLLHRRRRVPAIAAGVVVGLSLIGAGEAMHLRHLTTSDASAGPASVVTTPPRALADRDGHEAPVSEPPKVIERVEPQPHRAPPSPASRRRAVKTARAETQAVSSATVHPRERRRRTTAAGSSAASGSSGSTTSPPTATRSRQDSAVSQSGLRHYARLAFGGAEMGRDI